MFPKTGYSRAVGEFLTWCEGLDVASLTAVQPLHVASWIEMQSRKVSPPTVKQQLAALRHLFDWLTSYLRNGGTLEKAEMLT